MSCSGSCCSWVRKLGMGCARFVVGDPGLVVYGALYGGAADPRWHECGHGTAFRTSWLNELVYFPASFMLLREPTVWRWSHVRHHSDTIVVGRDAEIVFPDRSTSGRGPSTCSASPACLRWYAGSCAMRVVDSTPTSLGTCRPSCTPPCGGPRLPRRDRRCACRLCRDGWSRAAAVHGGPDVLWGVADGLLRDDPARRGFARTFSIIGGTPARCA